MIIKFTQNDTKPTQLLRLKRLKHIYFKNATNLLTALQLSSGVQIII